MQRDVVKWLQSLDLSGAVHNPRHDLANGFLIAEVLSRYDRAVSMHSFDSGLSTATKWDNWCQVKKVLDRLGCSTVSHDEIAAVVAGKEGAAQTVLGKLYYFLTKKSSKAPLAMRTTPQSEAPFYARPTAAKLLHDANTVGKDRVSKFSGDMDEKTNRDCNEAIVMKHRIDLNTLKIVARERYIPKERSDIAPREDTRVKPKCQKFQATRTVNVHNLDSEIMTTFFERDQREKEEAFKRGFSEQMDLSQSLSHVCHRELQRFGVLEILEAKDGGNDGCRPNYFSKFTALRSALLPEVKKSVWHALLEASRNTAALCVSRPTEFLHLVINFSFLWDHASVRKMAAPDLDCVQAFEIMSAVGKHARSMNAETTHQFVEAYFIPALASFFQSSSFSFFNSAISMLCSYVDANHLEDVKFIINVIQRCVPQGSEYVFRTAYSVLSKIDFSLCLGADGLCQYYAIVGSTSAKSVSRGLALNLLELLVPHNHKLVLPLLSTVEALGSDDFWEVRLAQLSLLCKLVDQIQHEQTPVEDGSTEDTLTSGTTLLLPAFATSVRKTFNGFHNGSTEQKLLALQMIAPYLDFEQDPELCRSFVKAILSLEDRARLSVLSNCPTVDVCGKLRMYTLGGMTQIWNALAIAKAQMSVGFSVGVLEMLSLMEPLVLTTNLCVMREDWLEVLSTMKGDLLSAVFEPERVEGLSPADVRLCSEMACSIVMKYYADLSGETIEEDGELPEIQQRAMDWLQKDA